MRRMRGRRVKLRTMNTMRAENDQLRNLTFLRRLLSFEFMVERHSFTNSISGVITMSSNLRSGRLGNVRKKGE